MTTIASIRLESSLDPLILEITNRLLRISPSDAQYYRNHLWLHVFSSLLKKKDMDPLTRRQLAQDLPSLLRDEVKKHTGGGSLYLYLHLLLTHEINTPPFLIDHTDEFLQSISFLVFLNDDLETIVPPLVRSKALSLSRKDTNTYLSLCVK